VVETSTFLSVFYCYVIAQQFAQSNYAVAMSLYQIIIHDVHKSTISHSF